MSEPSPLGLFARYLSLWVGLCILTGIGLGYAFPSLFQVVAGLEYANVNFVIAVLIWVMIYPMMTQVDFSSLKNLGRRPRGLCITLVVNWLIKPFSMAALGILFFEHIFADVVEPQTAKEYIAGMILLGVAPCTAMVFVWSQLTRGDAGYTLVQVSINDLIMVFAFAPIAAFLLGITDIVVPWETLLLSVVLYVVIPLVAGYLTRNFLNKKDPQGQAFNPNFALARFSLYCLPREYHQSCSYLGRDHMNRRRPHLGPRNKTVQVPSGLPWLFTDKAVTAWGGLRLMQEFLMRLHFQEMLTASPLPHPLSNRGYSPVLMVESFLVAVWVGGVHFAHTALVRFDAALCEIFGWSQVASVATFTRFFRRFRQSTNQAVSAHWAHWLWQQVPSTTLTLDLDSSVLTRYGTQEGAARGYNPQKKGRPSHHPLFAFVADLRMVLHAWLRPGNTADSSGLTTFFDEAVAPLGGRHRIGLVRADAGFCTNAVLTHFETRSLNYIVAGRLLPGLRLLLPGLTAWTAVDRGLAVTEIPYQAQGWPQERRIIVIRQEVVERPQAQGKLLKDVPGYRYQLFVTNLALPPTEVWRLYRHRADSENRIAELKQDFGLTGFCLDSFWGTEAAFQTVLLAYNLMSLFRQALLRAPRAVKLSTMRAHCFALGAWVGRQGRRKVLRISVPPQRRPWFEGLFARLEGFHPPWPAPGSNA